jgi:DNA-binding transcriptional LysR family regulator
MDKFQEMRTFVAVVDAGSFVGGADSLNMSKAATSRNISDLESRLGVRLLHRTTRRLSLTDEGEVFFARCKELLVNIESAENEITSRTDEAVGLIRINAPVTFGILHLAGLWGDFKASHPKVMLDITLGDRIIDIVDEGYDLAVRIAQLPNSTLVSRKLATTRLVLCASPTYLKKAGTPKHPSALIDHAVLAYAYTSDQWEFTRDQETVSVRINPRLKTNNGDTCVAGALKHQGIILQPTFMVGPSLKSGALVEILPKFKSVELGIYVVYPTRKLLSAKVRLLIDFLIDSFKQPIWAD